jgi:imidazolonepropionase-like amidohydrolase
LIWEAGWNAKRGAITSKDAIAAITWNVADAFSLSAGNIVVGRKAEFVAYDSDPFNLKAHVNLVAGGAHGVLCYPKQA